MNADMMDGIPHWANHIAVLWTLFSVATVTVCSWLANVLPLPSEVNSPRYAIFFGIVQRVSMGGRRNWKNGNGNKLNSNGAAVPPV